ncbi:MAG TPA: PstS family phosphate ABC transporter substrate-binding protein [Actinomycetota bacterium]
MIKPTNGVRAFAIAALLATVAAACGSSEGNEGGDQLTGTIRIDGSSTVAPLSEAAAELFMGENRDVQVTVAASGTSGGFQKFCIGENDMNDASRPIKESEVEQCGQNAIAYDAIQVANDALSLLVNAQNPVDCLTVEQATQVWDRGSKVKTWGQVTGLNAPGDFAGRQMTLYGPGSDSGTFDFFTDEINGEEGRIRIDYTNIGEDDRQAVDGIKSDVGAMGYVPYSYAQEAGEGVKALAIDGGGGCVDATLENVQNGSYVPLGRPLFVYASGTALAKPEVLAFMKFYVDNATSIADAASFVPLTEAQVAAQHQKIEELVSGVGQ